MASAERWRANETDFHWNEREYIDDFFTVCDFYFTLRIISTENIPNEFVSFPFKRFAAIATEHPTHRSENKLVCHFRYTITLYANRYVGVAVNWPFSKTLFQQKITENSIWQISTLELEKKSFKSHNALKSKPFKILDNELITVYLPIWQFLRKELSSLDFVCISQKKINFDI